MHLFYFFTQWAWPCFKPWAFSLWASLVLSSVAWANTTPPLPVADEAAAQLGAWQAISTASWPVQITLLILVLMSVLSWTIVFCKKKQLQQIKKSNQEFLDAFWQASSLDNIFHSSNQYAHSTLARLFQNSYIELNKLKHSRAMAYETGTSQATSSEGTAAGGPSLKDALSSLPLSMEYLDRSLRKAIDTELPSLESHLNFLATTGSTAPFIGLFGTVWGIMGAFQKIAQANSASLAVVAPGIAEALIATAIGLAVAIPATVAYNHFVARVRCEELDLHNFAGDFLNLTKRNLYKPSGGA